MLSESYQYELIDTSDLAFEPKSDKVILSFADAFIDTPYKESLEISGRSLLDIYRDAWKTLNPPDGETLPKDYNEHVESERRMILSYWKGILLKISHHSTEEQQINLSTNRNGDGSFTYNITHYDGDVKNNFSYRFHPGFKSIDLNFNFPQSSSERRDENGTIRESYMNNFRKGDLTYMERKLSIDDERGYKKLDKVEFLHIRRD